MITCPHCGETIEESKFCFYCGKPLQAWGKKQQPVVPVKVQEPADVPVVKHEAEAKQSKLDEWGEPITNPEMPAVVSGILAKIKPGRTLSSIPDMNDFKKRATSWLFLGFLLSFSLYILIELIGALSGSYNLFNAYNICASLVGKLTDSSIYMDYYTVANLLDLSEMFNIIQSLRIIIRLACLIPTAFTLYGVWHFFVSATNEKKDRVSLKGLKAIDLVYKYYSIIQLVYGVIAAGVVAVAGVMAFDDYYYDEEEGIQLIISAVLVLVYYALNFVYIMKFREALRIIAKTVKKGAYNSKALISNYVIIWNIVLCVITLIFVCESYNPAAHLFEMISLILITVVIVGYNKKLQGKAMPKIAKSDSEFDFDESND